MLLPVIRGVIDRRILVNFRVDPDALANVVPHPFRPKIIDGRAIAGICLIRLKGIRPRYFPASWGVESENAAHRIAVEWTTSGEQREGVFVTRRDTSSRFNAMMGGRCFPGVHHHAKIESSEKDGRYRVSLVSDDGLASLVVDGNATQEWSSRSIFPNVDAASRFFAAGSIGYSASLKSNSFEGLELRCTNWSMTPLAIKQVESSFFNNLAVFPHGSVEFDSALLMRGIEHEWHSQDSICNCETSAP